MPPFSLLVLVPTDKCNYLINSYVLHWLHINRPAQTKCTSLTTLNLMQLAHHNSGYVQMIPSCGLLCEYKLLEISSSTKLYRDFEECFTYNLSHNKTYLQPKVYYYYLVSITLHLMVCYPLVHFTALPSIHYFVVEVGKSL